jgi:Flp pilus assembly protein TadG
MKPLLKIWKNDGGASGVEFALIVPLLAILFLGIVSGREYYHHLGNMRDSVEAGAKYYLQGGRDDEVAEVIAAQAWTDKPKTGALSINRQCVCGETSVSCNLGVVCPDESVPKIQITLTAKNVYTDIMTEFVVKDGLPQSQKQVVRVR